MADGPTCGKGLAAHSSLPAKLGELTGAVAGILEVHIGALDLGDERSRREQGVYLRLVEAHRRTAAELRATAGEMAAQRDLLALLQERLGQDQELLAGMRRGG